MTLFTVELIAGGLAVLALVYFFGLPWVKPLYARYRAWVDKTASGQKG